MRCTVSPNIRAPAIKCAWYCLNISLPDMLVTERTLNILYAAQRQQAQPHSQSREPHTDFRQHSHNVPVAAQPASSSSSSSSHQTSLHSFWNLPSRPPALPASNLPNILTETPTECEDCGHQFKDGEDVTMDGDDMLGLGGSSCGACGKHVCSNCSISNLGEQRRCLACAGTTVGNSTGGDRGTPWSRGISSWLC